MTSVRAGTPAAAAGLCAGDVVTSVEGRRIASAAVLQSAIDARPPGETVLLTYTSGGSSHTVRVKLATRPS